MCGIFCACSFNRTETESNFDLNKLYERCKANIIHRGPNYSSLTTYNSGGCELVLAASVLWLQGSKPTYQPIETDNSIFVYNGDIFGGSLVSDESRREGGDTRQLLKCLENSDNILVALLKAQGPYTFIHLDKKNSCLYFARDKYGRRSLIIGVQSQTLLLSSVFPETSGITCIELPALGVFCYNLKLDKLSLYPWPFKHSNFITKLNELETVLARTVVVEQTTTVLCKPFREPSELDLCYYKELHKLDAFQTLLQNNDWHKKVSRLCTLLETALQKRIGTQPPFCQNCIQDRLDCSHATTGVLFSGGIDCAILALLSDKFIDKSRPIDLLNVAFSIDAPDRITGRQTFNELKHLRPYRTWNFVEIDVTGDELQEIRSAHIRNLIHPLKSVLDDSLGCALWFASRGRSKAYQSPCRVLLVGMGADELFGGYTKHRAAFKRGGWAELNQLLEDDWQNISHRNLARDDRVVSDHGRQLRTPYLDEDVVEFVRGLNCWERTYPSELLPHGIGEKILLRSFGFHLGLANAAGLKKRALQFGSRIANSKENASDISPRL